LDFFSGVFGAKIDFLSREIIFNIENRRISVFSAISEPLDSILTAFLYENFAEFPISMAGYRISVEPDADFSTEKELFLDPRAKISEIGCGKVSF
jgi:hypothetical protein